MNPRSRGWLLILSIVALCGLILGGVIWYRSRALSAVAMLKRLPSADSVVVYADFRKLKDAGLLELLNAGKVTADPEYRSFVQSTAFDWEQDLDAAMVSFAPKGNYLLVRGHFDWKTLRKYVEGSGGHCNNSFCKVAGSSPSRRISYFPMQSNLMAMGVSDDDSAALRLNTVEPGTPPEIPGAPLWLMIPPSVVKSGRSLPAGTQMYARSLERAQAVTLALASENGQFAAKLTVRCATAAEAATMAADLSKITALLHDMIEREHHQPDPDNLSGFLTSGVFRADGANVSGYWPVSRALLTNLFAGAGAK